MASTIDDRGQNSSGVIIGLYHQAERLAARNGDSL